MVGFRQACLILLAVSSSTWSRVCSEPCPSGCEDCFCPNDQELMCSAHQATVLPPCLSPDLRVLTIFGSNIPELHRGDFANATGLEILRITDSPLRTIEVGTFEHLTNLQDLRLDDNELSSFTDGLFSELSNLTDLSANRNQLSMISGQTFNGLGNLVTLSLANNSIGGHLPSVAFTGMDKLEVIDLAGNSLTYIEDLAGATSLRELILKDNNLESLHGKLFASNLRLERLELQRNSITNIEALTFAGLDALAHLDLAGNHLTQVAEALKYADAVETLVLDENEILEIMTNSFNGMNSLKHLNMNRMESLQNIQDGAFKALSNLEKLSLAENPGLTSFGSSALPPDEVPLLKTLLLNNNSLTEIEEGLFMRLDLLETADVSGNPVHCNCDADWIRVAMDDESIPWIRDWIVGPNAVVCGSPYYFTGRRIYEFSARDLTCSVPDEHPIAIITDATSIIIKVTLSPGLPVTNWTLPNGQGVSPARPIHPQTAIVRGHTTAQALEEVIPDNVILATLTVDNPDASYSGVYTLHATNAGGTKDYTENIDWSGNGGGGLSGGEIAAIIFGVLVLVAVGAFLVCMVWYYKYRSKYVNMEEEEEDEERRQGGTDVNQPQDPRAPPEAATLAPGRRPGYGSTANPVEDPGDRLINRADIDTDGNKAV